MTDTATEGAGTREREPQCSDSWHFRLGGPGDAMMCPRCGASLKYTGREAEAREREAAGPDLSHLPEPLRLRLALAPLVLGATWFEAQRGEWWLESPAGPPHYAATLAALHSDGHFATYFLPDWENDPAAWGALMERELVGWESEGTQHVCQFVEPGKPVFAYGPYAPTLGRAVCLAVLAKHGVPWVEPNAEKGG